MCPHVANPFREDNYAVMVPTERSRGGSKQWVFIATHKCPFEGKLAYVWSYSIILTGLLQCIYHLPLLEHRTHMSCRRMIKMHLIVRISLVSLCDMHNS